MQIFPITATVAILASLIATGLADTGVHCGTSGDATLSDCQALVDPATWAAAFNPTNKCTFTNPFIVALPSTAFNVACHDNCCVYVAGVSGADLIDIENTRVDAAALFGCADTAKNKINGMQRFDDGHGICVSNGNGCGDCFNDIDFAA